MDFIKLQNVITEQCSAKGVSQNTAFNESGVGRSFYDNIKKGSVPSVDKLQALAMYFGISLDYLVGNTDYPYVVTAAEMAALKKPNIISKKIAAFGGAETITVDSDALKAAIDQALKEKGLI